MKPEIRGGCNLAYPKRVEPEHASASSQFSDLMVVGLLWKIQCRYRK